MSIKSGYFKKHLAVDLSAGSCTRVDLEESFLRDYIGGRGFGAKMVWDNLVAHDFKVDPLGTENLLVIAPGPLTGLYLPSSGKCSFISLSPSTGVYGDSSMGGSFGAELRQSGLDLYICHADGSRTLQGSSAFMTKAQALVDRLDEERRSKVRLKVLGS